MLEACGIKDGVAWSREGGPHMDTPAAAGGTHLALAKNPPRDNLDEAMHGYLVNGRARHLESICRLQCIGAGVARPAGTVLAHKCTSRGRAAAENPCGRGRGRLIHTSGRDTLDGLKGMEAPPLAVAEQTFLLERAMPIRDSTRAPGGPAETASRAVLA